MGYGNVAPAPFNSTCPELCAWADAAKANATATRENTAILRFMFTPHKFSSSLNGERALSELSGYASVRNGLDLRIREGGIPPARFTPRPPRGCPKGQYRSEMTVQ